MTVSFPLTLTDRFALIIRALHAAVAARIKCPPVTAAIIVYVCARLRRIGAEFEKLAGQIRAGTYVARPAGKRRAGGAASRRGVSIVMSHYNLGLPPWAPGWLHRVAPGDAGVWAGSLRQLLSEPEMAAVIVAVPRMRRILQPLCFMLGVETRLLGPPPPRTPRAAVIAGADGAATDVAPIAPDRATRAPGVETGVALVAAGCGPTGAGAIFGLC